MGEVPRGHEALPPEEQDALRDYDATGEVDTAHTIVESAFAAHKEDEDSRGNILEQINDIKREMFWLNSQIDKSIGARPAKDQQTLREQRVDIFHRYEKFLEQFRAAKAEDTKDFLELLQPYKEELSALLERLESEGGPETKAK